ncbi:MAG: tol-pal system-associated acyl-CoA thioesterase [Gammaproteobacteria bacterium]|nr:tol-pal system-associated acyl-CoA thioesterase [Gammaproteobacteria bacterium]MBU1414448.1 tol-pal system-associated acyl-CoA thioesterase [Gammaproteobacteria bacterium]
MKNFTWPVRVYFEDTDVGGVVYYANYLRYLERARSEWLRTMGFDQSRLMQDTGLGFAVRSVAAEYLKPARLDDELRVSCGIKMLGRAQIVFEQTIERGTETLLTATIRLACMDLARGRAAAVPQDIYDQFAKLTI